jgi:membrane fusion protein, macrolide-specific efflux system
MKRKLFALVVLVAIGIAAMAVTFGGFGAAAATTNQYLTTPATVGNVTDEVAATGSLAAATTYGLVFGADPYLSTGEDGEAPQAERTWPVTDVRVKPGDRVKAGDVLATASTADARRDLATATADLRTANINLTIARERLADARDADDTDAERQALMQFYAAQNQQSQASTDRGAIQRQIKAATLRAPIDGVVAEVNITKGFDAPAGAAILVASTSFTVTTDVVESDLADMELDQKATVTVDAIGAELEGTVTAISPTAGDSQTGVVSYPVTITVVNPPATARAGMSADVTITTATATNVLTVPSTALNGGEGQYAVMVLNADGTTRMVPVDVGLVTNTMAEIKSGLDEGANVVTGTTADLLGNSFTGAGGFRGGVAIPGNGPVQRVEGPDFKQSVGN